MSAVCDALLGASHDKHEPTDSAVKSRLLGVHAKRLASQENHLLENTINMPDIILRRLVHTGLCRGYGNYGMLFAHTFFKP
jgi:hypothetical protein